MGGGGEGLEKGLDCELGGSSGYYMLNDAEEFKYFNKLCGHRSTLTDYFSPLRSETHGNFYKYKEIVRFLQFSFNSSLG